MHFFTYDMCVEDLTRYTQYFKQLYIKLIVHYSQPSHQQLLLVCHRLAPGTRNDGEILERTCTQETLQHSDNVSVCMHIYMYVYPQEIYYCIDHIQYNRNNIMPTLTNIITLKTYTHTHTDRDGQTDRRTDNALSSYSQ